MPIQFTGHGALLGADQQPIERVEYTFELDVERGLIGMIRSSNPYLSRTTILRLRLQDNVTFVAVYLGMGLYNRERGTYAHQIFLAEEQPDEPNNLVSPRPGRPKLEPGEDNWG